MLKIAVVEQRFFGGLPIPVAESVCNCSLIILLILASSKFIDLNKKLTVL